MSTVPYQQHIKDNVVRDVSNLLWNMVPDIIRKLDSSERGGSSTLERLIETYAVQFDTIKRAIDIILEARHTSYVNYLRNNTHAFTDELYSFLAKELNLDITPEMLGTVQYGDVSNVWRNAYEREQWDIILQNIAYFYKHRGTLEGIKALGRIFGMASPGQGDFNFSPLNSYVNLHRDWFDNFSYARSRFTLPDERFYQDKSTYTEITDINTNNGTSAWYYPKWVKWAQAMDNSLFGSTYLSQLDVTERGIYTNVFLPYQKETHKQYQWFNDITEPLGHFEGAFSEAGMFIPGYYGLVIYPTADGAVYGNVHTNSAMHRYLTTAEREAMFDDGDGQFSIQFTGLPAYSFFRETTYTQNNLALYNAYFKTSENSGYKLYEDATNAGTEIGYQKMITLYPIVVKGSYGATDDVSNLIECSNFGNANADLALILLAPETAYTFDILAENSGLPADKPWDTYSAVFVTHAYDYTTSPSCPDWWKFRDELYYNDVAGGRRCDTWKYLDLISIGPEVSMPFYDIGTIDYWKTELYDSDSKPLEPSAPVVDFDNTVPYSSSSSYWWGSNKWAYGNPAPSEKMYNGGYVLCATLDDGTPVFARCPFQAIIRMMQMEDYMTYTHPQYDAYNGIGVKTIWHYSEEASNWQWKNRYTDENGDVVYPLDYTTEEGLTVRSGQDQYNIGVVTEQYAGRQEKLVSLDLSSVYPNSQHSGGRIDYTIVNSSGGEDTSGQDASNLKTMGIPMPYIKNKSAVDKQISVVIDDTKSGTGPNDAQVRWYYNGMRVWHADYRFSKIEKDMSSGKKKYVGVTAASDFTTHGIGNTDTRNILAFNHLPHNYSALGTKNNLGATDGADAAKNWWFEDRDGDKGFWGIGGNVGSRDASNMFKYVLKHRRFISDPTVRDLVIWKTAIDANPSVNKTVLQGSVFKGSLYKNVGLLNEVSNLLVAYYPFVMGYRSSDIAEKGDPYSRMVLHDFSGNGLALFKEASNYAFTSTDVYSVWNTRYKPDAYTYLGAPSKLTWARGGPLHTLFEGDFPSRLNSMTAFSTFLEGVWRAPSESLLPDFMTDDLGNLKDVYWSHRSIRPVSELENSKLQGAQSNAYGRAAKAEWLSRSRHLEPYGEDDAGNEVYTVDSAGGNKNRFGSGDYLAARDYYYNLPSNAWWSGRKSGTYATIPKGTLANVLYQITKPDPWNYLLKYANQGMNTFEHNSISGSTLGLQSGGDMFGAIGDGSTTIDGVFYSAPILDESHRIATMPVIWTYGGITQSLTGDVENVLATARGWLPRSAKKSWGLYPSEAWHDQNAAYAIDASQYGSPHIFLKRITEEDRVSAVDIVLMPYVDLLSNTAFIRVYSLDFSINNVLLAITAAGVSKNNLWISEDGGASWTDWGLLPSVNILINSYILDTHVQPLGIFGVDYWTYLLSNYSVFSSTTTTSHDAYGKISYSSTTSFTLNEGEYLDIDTNFEQYNTGAIVSSRTRDSKHSIMDAGYGGGMVLLTPEQVGRSGYDDTTVEFLLTFGGAGHPFAQDFFNRRYTTGSDFEYESSNIGNFTAAQPKPSIGFGNRYWGGSFYGSRHMTDDFAQCVSNAATTLYSTPGYGIGVPRNVAFDVPNLLLDVGDTLSPNYTVYAVRNRLPGTYVFYNHSVYPIFSNFAFCEHAGSPNNLRLNYSSPYNIFSENAGNIGSILFATGTTVYYAVATPAMYRGDSGYMQGRFQFVRFRNPVDASNWTYSSIETSSPDWGTIYYNYGLNYPMTLVGMHGEVAGGGYTESVHKALTASIDSTNVYYLGDREYEHKDFIPTILGRDSRRLVEYADDAFMNMASFIRFNAGCPSNDGTDQSAVVYQGNFSQYPYLWNQWTRPINLIGGYRSRWWEVARAFRAMEAYAYSNQQNGGFDLDTEELFQYAYINTGYLAEKGGYDNWKWLENPTSTKNITSYALPDGYAEDKLKLLDVQDILQPIGGGPTTSWYSMQSGLLHALTQSILSDMGSPRATMYLISPRDTDDVNASVLGRRPFMVRLVDKDRVSPTWDEVVADPAANTVNVHIYSEEFDAPVSRIFTSWAFDTDNKALYNLGGVPNTFALGHGGYLSRYIGGQLKNTLMEDAAFGNRYDNNYFSNDSWLNYKTWGLAPSEDTEGFYLLESSSPFWGGYKGMKRVSFDQETFFSEELVSETDNERTGVVFLGVSNPADADSWRRGTAWIAAPGQSGYGHNDPSSIAGSPSHRIFGQLVYVSLSEFETEDPSDVGQWLYYIGGNDNLTNLEIIRHTALQGVFSANFYNAPNINLDLTSYDYVISPSNAWWLTGIQEARYGLAYSSVADFNKHQFLGDPFFQYSTMNDTSNLFPFANSGFIGTTIGLKWRTVDDGTPIDYSDAGTGTYPFSTTDTYNYNLLWKDGSSDNYGVSRYHELEGPTNAVYRFQIKDYYGKFRMRWDASRQYGSDVSNWGRIMANAVNPEYGYTGQNYGCIPGYFAPNFTDDKKRALANQDYMHMSGLFDHCAVVANDGYGKKMYIFGGNTNQNGWYDEEWVDPSSYYKWKDQPAISTKGKNIEIWPFGDSEEGWGMRPIAGIGASSSRQMYIMDFKTNIWQLGSPMPASGQKIGAARVPIIWRSRGPVSSIGTLADPSQIDSANQYVIFEGTRYLPINIGVDSGLLEDKPLYYRGFAYLTGGSSPVRIPCTDVSSGQVSSHSDYNDYGPWEADYFNAPVKWYSGTNIGAYGSTGVIICLGLGPAYRTFRISEEYFDFGKWRWGQDPKDYMASPMRKIRIFSDTELVRSTSLSDYNIVHRRISDNFYTSEDTQHVYYDTWQKVGWGNDMLLPPNPTQEWVGWKDGTAGYRGMASCVIPARDVSNSILKSREIGDWIIAAGGYSDGIFTPETGNTRWRDLNDALLSRRGIANELNKNLGVTLNRKIFVYSISKDSWFTLPIELPTPQVWGNVVWSSNLNSLIFYNGKQDVRTKGGLPRLITQPDDALEQNADDISIDLLTNKFYNRANLGNFAWAGLYKNWREEDHYLTQSEKYDPSNSILSLMFTQPTMSLSWNPLSQIRWSDIYRKGSYSDYMKSMWAAVNSMVNRKLGVSTATGWDEVGGVEADYRYGLDESREYTMGAGDMHWWGYPCMHDWRAGQRYRAVVAPPPSEYMRNTVLSVIGDPSQSFLYNTEVDMHTWPWFMPHKIAMHMPYYMSGWNFLFQYHMHSATNHGIVKANDHWLDIGSFYVSVRRNRLPNMKYCDIIGALRPYSTTTVDTWASIYERFSQNVIPAAWANYAGFLIGSTDTILYPISGVGLNPGNKYQSDIYSPWHATWNRSQQLGRSVREFGGVSFDSWIGFIHGGGEPYYKGFDFFKESSENWYPRGWDLAPSEYKVLYGALGRHLYNGEYTHLTVGNINPVGESNVILTEIEARPYSFIRSNKYGVDENPVLLQNVHTFTDLVNYNAIVCTGYMSPFWSAIEEIIASVPTDLDDQQSQQLLQFFGNANKISYGSEGIIEFSDVWNAQNYRTLGNGWAVSANTPRFIFQVSRKIFNSGRMFELHFSDVGVRNLINNTNHYTHFVGHNGFYISGVYNEDAGIFTWQNGGQDIFDVRGANPKDIRSSMDITSINFNRNIHTNTKHGVLTFRENDYSAFYAQNGTSSYHYAYYKDLGTFDPADHNNWYMVNIPGLEFAVNSSFVVEDDENVVAWMCGNEGLVLKAIWSDDTGFQNYEIVNLKPEHSLFASTGRDSATSDNLKSIYFIGLDTASNEGQSGVYGWATGDNGIVLRTTDSGETWKRTQIKEGLICNKIVFYNTQNGFIVTNEGVYKSKDGGITWVKDRNSESIAVGQDWTDIVALPPNYRLWNQSLLPKVFAVSRVDAPEAARWTDTPGLSRYHHKSTVGIGAAPLSVTVNSGEIKRTPTSGKANYVWPESQGKPGVEGGVTPLPSKSGDKLYPERRLGYTFYPSNNFSLHLYDPTRHIREGM